MIDFGWRDIDANEALQLGLEQAGRWQWQMFHIGICGYGIAIMARVKP